MSPLVLEQDKSGSRPLRERCPDRWWLWDSISRTHLLMRCDRWHCPVCGQWKRSLLIRKHRVQPPTHDPQACLTLTSVDPDIPPELFRRAHAQVFQRLRRHYGAMEYFSHLEFTTGLSARSGGFRRPHTHSLLRFDIPPTDYLEVESLVRETWESMTGARVVQVAALRTKGGMVAYLSNHFAKAGQQPPPDWVGRRIRSSRGYWALGSAGTEQVALASILDDAARWKAERALGDALRRSDSAAVAALGRYLAATSASGRRILAQEVASC